MTSSALENLCYSKESPLFEEFPFEWQNLFRALEIISIYQHARGLKWCLRRRCANRRNTSRYITSDFVAANQISDRLSLKWLRYFFTGKNFQWQKFWTEKFYNFQSFPDLLYMVTIAVPFYRNFACSCKT